MASVGHETSLGLCFNFVGREIIYLVFFRHVGVSFKPFPSSSELTDDTPLGSFDQNLGFAVVGVSNIKEVADVWVGSWYDEDRQPKKLVQNLQREQYVTKLQSFGSMTPTNNMDVRGRGGRVQVNDEIIFS